MARLFLHVGLQKSDSQNLVGLLRDNQSLLDQHEIDFLSLDSSAAGSATRTGDWLEASSLVSRNLIVSDHNLYRNFSDDDFVAKLNRYLTDTDSKLAILLLTQNPVDTQYARYLDLPPSLRKNLTLAEFFKTLAREDQHEKFQQIGQLLRTSRDHGYSISCVNTSSQSRPLSISEFANVISNFIELPDNALKTDVTPVTVRPFNQFEIGAADALKQAFSSVNRADIDTLFTRLITAIPEVNIDDEKYAALKAAGPAVDEFSGVIEQDRTSVNKLLPPASRFNPGDSGFATNEFHNLDRNYGSLFVSNLARTVLDVLSLNLVDEDRLHSLAILCEKLTSMQTSTDLRFWNAYSQALRAAGDSQARNASETARQLRKNSQVQPQQTEAVQAQAPSVDTGNKTKTDAKIFLHIGHSKTGSSFIQSVLAHNQARLVEQGIYYPLPERDRVRAARGDVTSGNRRIISDPELLDRALSHEGSLLLSNESMWMNFEEPHFVDLIASAARRSGRTVAVFFCLRDPVEHIRSRFMQVSQIGKSSLTISEFFQGQAIDEQIDLFNSILKVIAVCERNSFELEINNYSTIRSNLLPVFCQFLGVSNTDYIASDIAVTKVNRSLNTVELGARRALNRLFQDYQHLPQDKNYLRDLVDATPRLNASLPMPSADALERFLGGIGEDLDFINSKLPSHAKYRLPDASLSGKAQSNRRGAQEVEPATARYGDLLAHAVARIALSAFPSPHSEHNAKLLEQMRKRISKDMPGPG